MPDAHHTDDENRCDWVLSFLGWRFKSIKARVTVTMEQVSPIPEEGHTRIGGAPDDPRRQRMTDLPSKKSWLKRCNWWKIGFFIMLVLFELAREWAVLASYPEPKIATSAYVGSFGGFTSAKGRWIRLDGGSSIVPTAVNIECSEERRECLEVTAHSNDGYLSEPNVDRFDASFTSDAVSYKNDDPDCASYSVRIDLNLKKVIAVRIRKENPTNDMCAGLERRVEMTLGDGYQSSDKPTTGHFVPLIDVLILVLQVF